MAAQSAYCSQNGRFSQDAFFRNDQIVVQSNVPFATVKNWMNVSETLKLDVYYPALSQDPLALRPLILLIHGGAFIVGDKSNLSGLCLEMARRGFIAVSMDYRLGQDCIADPLSREKAAYRAQQDAMAALRFLVSNAASVRADTSWIFLGGGSAGSATALNTVYMTQSDWDKVSPQLSTLLGPLNSSGNALTNSYTIKGIFNNWGAVLKDQIQKNEMLPMVSFHGDADLTVAIDSAFGGGCTNALKTYGSRSLHYSLMNQGICSDLTVQPGGGHGIYEDSLGTMFRAGRAACFFKSLFCNNCTSFYQTDTQPASCNVGTTAATIADTKNDLTIYPNPFSDELFINGLKGVEYFRLFDCQGKLLEQGKAISENHFSKLIPGLYFLKIIDNTEEKTFHIVKTMR